MSEKESGTKLVSLRELEANGHKLYVDAFHSGQPFVVTHHGKFVGVFLPLSNDDERRLIAAGYDAWLIEESIKKAASAAEAAKAGVAVPDEPSIALDDFWPVNRDSECTGFRHPVEIKDDSKWD